MALVFSASEKMNRDYRDAIIEVSDNVNLALRDGFYSSTQEAIEEEMSEFLGWYDNAAIVYGYLLGTDQCTTANEARQEFYSDILENLGF